MSTQSSVTQAQDLNRQGIALAQAERLAEAAELFRQALTLDPGLADAHNNLANVCLKHRQYGDAIRHYQQAIGLNPLLVRAYNNLGLSLQEMGQFDEAVRYLQRALEIQPDYHEALFNLANVLASLGQTDKAEAAYRQLIQNKPDHALSYNNLGNLMIAKDRWAEAEALYRKAVEARPDFVEGYYNIGNARHECGDFAGAVAAFDQAIALRPHYLQAIVNQGNAYRFAGQLDKALACYQRAAAIDPQSAQAQKNAAMTWLALGDYERGWPAYEWRWRSDQIPLPDVYGPLWDGSDLTGKTILLHTEQGLGDGLHFVRYAPMVKARGGRVLLLCPTELCHLFQSVQGVDEVLTRVPDKNLYQTQAPLMSLPMIFGTTLDTIPAEGPYLAAEKSAVWIWSERLRRYRDKVKIGLVWAGNARIENPSARQVDKRRSMRLRDFARLFSVPDVAVFSLQKGPPATQIAENPDLPIIDWTRDLYSFHDTAALISNLDLVIGVDTSVIHVAGALGKPVWVMSRSDGCWRWLRDRDDTPWYPSMRLFRQRHYNDWQPVLEELFTALPIFIEKVRK